MNELESTAYHEAGHIVVAHCVGLKVQYVTIIPSDDYLGHAFSQKQHENDNNLLQKFMNYDIPDDMSVEEYDENINRIITQDLLHSLGGYVAEKIYGIDNTIGASSDFKGVVDFALAHYGSADDASLEINKHLLKVEEILKDNWHYVKSLAASLLEKKELTRDEILQLLEG
jgi:ATP-dependent Zn protease